MAKTIFQDGDRLAKLPGTRVMAAWLNKVFSHRHDGRDQDGSAPLDFAEDIGVANAVVATMPEPMDALIVGLPFMVRIAHANTGATTVTVDGHGPHPLQKLGGRDLYAGDIQATQIVQLAWDGVCFQLLSYNSPPVTDAETLQGQTAHQLVPPGMRGDFFMPTMPDGWLPCDGRAVLRAQYPDLFAAIGTTWGAGDNVSTFNLPDGRGEFFRGWDNGRGVDVDREFGSWQDDQFRSHAHGVGAFNQQAGGGSGFTCLGNDYNRPTTAVGGPETRPRNLTVFVGIKY